MNNPIIEVPTWTIHDATKIQAYMNCPRKYFYEYVLGWRPEEPNIHLVLGEAWHRAMEILLLYGYDADAVTLAYMELEKYYRQFFPPIMDDSFYPKTPGFAKEMLYNYVTRFPNDHLDTETIYTETSGSVVVDDKHEVYFRLDAMLRGKTGLFKDKFFAREHKTTSRNTYVWRDQWTLKIQIGVYSHVIKCIFGPDAKGVEINGAIFAKTKPDFVRLPILIDSSKMNVWLHTVRRWMKSIDREFELLADCKEEDDVLTAFPMLSENCTNYNKLCTYHDFCVSWSNPLRRLEPIPMGFVTSHWNPVEIETTNKLKKIQL